MARQNYGGGHDRTGQRRHAGFIYARDEIESLRPQVDLEAKEIMQPLAFSPVLPPAFANLFGQMVGALAFIRLKRLDQSLWHRPRVVNKTLLQFRNGFAQKLLE